MISQPSEEVRLGEHLVSRENEEKTHKNDVGDVHNSWEGKLPPIKAHLFFYDTSSVQTEADGMQSSVEFLILSRVHLGSLLLNFTIQCSLEDMTKRP